MSSMNLYARKLSRSEYSMADRCYRIGRREAIDEMTAYWSLVKQLAKNWTRVAQEQGHVEGCQCSSCSFARLLHSCKSFAQAIEEIGDDNG